MGPPQPSSGVAQTPYSRPLAAWALLGTLIFASILNTTDRAVLNFLVDPIRHDLKITDVQIGLLQGLSFSLFYAFAGLPLGWLADHTSRVRLLTGGIALWSAGTVLSGLAPSYHWLFGCRMLVGFGEATLPPCAMSLIVDSFNPVRRGRSIGIYFMGGAMATGLAGLLVAWILTVAPRGAFDFIPGAAGAAPWRIAMVAAGALGAVVVFVLALQREPARHGLTLGVVGKPKLRQLGDYFGANAKVFLAFYGGFAVFSTASYGSIAWSAALLNRQFGLNARAASQNLGLAFVIAGVVGTLLASWILDRPRILRKRSAKLTLLAILPLCAAPAALATLAPNAVVATIQLAVMVAAAPMASVVAFGALAEMMPNDMRGFSVALVGVAGTMIGGVLGPLLIAACTEGLLHDPRLVGRAMLFVTTPALLLASAAFFLCRGALERSLRSGSSLARVMDADRPLLPLKD